MNKYSKILLAIAAVSALGTTSYAVASKVKAWSTYNILSYDQSSSWATTPPLSCSNGVTFPGTISPNTHSATSSNQIIIPSSISDEMPCTAVYAPTSLTKKYTCTIVVKAFQGNVKLYATGNPAYACSVQAGGTAVQLNGSS